MTTTAHVQRRCDPEPSLSEGARRPTKLRPLWAGLLGLVSTLALGGCYAEEIAELRSQVGRLSACQVCAQSQLTQGLALALCKAPVRQLIDSVAQVCKSEEVCLDQKIATLVGDADPTHLGRFISLMEQQRHAVLYFTPRDVLISGFEDLYSQRLLKVVQPQPPWLRTTRFLVVSNFQTPLGTTQNKVSKGDPAVVRAEARGLQIVQKILDFQFPGGQRVQKDQILLWLFSFQPKRGEQLGRDDSPVAGSDLSQSVWVFRIDCATPTETPELSESCQQCLPATPPVALQPLPPAAPPAVSGTSAPAATTP